MRRRSVPIVLAVGILAAACAGTSADSSTTQPGPSSTTTSASQPETSSTTSTAAPTTTSATTPPPTVTTDPPSRFIEAPAFDTWAAILASLPVDEYPRDVAEELALELPMPKIGVVQSDAYPSLNPGYWVIHGIPGADRFEADQTCWRLGDTVPDCYARYFGIDPSRALSFETGHVVAMDATGTLVVVDFETGAVVRTIGSFGGDGRYPGEPQLHPDRWVVYHAVGVEDSWFSCESSDGSLVEVDLATGRWEEIASGFAPALRGDELAYLAASECIPDPQQPGWVLAPVDTIVVRDLDTGRETRRRVSLDIGNEGYPIELSGLAWDAAFDALYVLDISGRVYRFDEGASNGTLITTLGGRVAWRLVGTDPATGLVLVERHRWVDDVSRTSVLWLDPLGGITTLLLDFDGNASAAYDSSGRTLGIAAGSRFVVGAFEYDLDTEIVFFDW